MLLLLDMPSLPPSSPRSLLLLLLADPLPRLAARSPSLLLLLALPSRLPSSHHPLAARCCSWPTRQLLAMPSSPPSSHHSLPLLLLLLLLLADPLPYLAAARAVIVSDVVESLSAAATAPGRPRCPALLPDHRR
jgi:hypothetical protein